MKSTAWNIERHYVARKYSEFNNKRTEYEECIKKRKDKENEINRLKLELSELKIEAKNVKIPAERINILLETTFPYRKIQLDDSENGIGYELKRNGERCNIDSLSEGERNFLALAYFLLFINDEEDYKLDDEAIIVIDDPVSSLDSDSLYQIYAVLIGEIKKHKDRQYFIFTHNLDFFGHLLQEYNTIKRKSVHFYQIKLDGNGSKVAELSEHLINYSSDYQYSITKLNDIKDSQELDDNIFAANLLRRVLETFLHFKYGHGDLRSKLHKLYLKYIEKIANGDSEKRAKIEQKIFQDKEAMYRFINHGSHEFMGIGKSDVYVLQGSSQMIKNFHNIIKTVDKDHYKTFIQNS